MPDARIAWGTCSREEPQPKFDADDEGGVAAELVAKRRVEALEEVVGHLLDVGRC